MVKRQDHRKWSKENPAGIQISAHKKKCGPKPESLNFHVADHKLPRSLVQHVESIDSPGNTPFAPSQSSGGTSSSRGSKRKGPMVDVIGISSPC